MALEETEGMPDSIVLVGDSITELWGFHRAGTFETYGLAARGYSGCTATGLAGQLPRDLSETGARGLHLLGGINDIAGNDGRCVPPEEIAATLLGMLDAARAAGVTAWIGSVLPAAGIPWNPAVTDVPASIDALNALLRAGAPAHGARFIDYHAVLAAPDGSLRPDYGTDGLHLSPAGYRAIEPLMLRSLGLVA